MKASNRKSHDQLVALAVENLRTQQVINIKASHIGGWTQPDQIGAYIPDITGTWGGGMIIVEAESEQGLSLQHTADQWQTFSQCVRSGGRFLSSSIMPINQRQKLC